MDRAKLKKIAIRVGLGLGGLLLLLVIALAGLLIWLGTDSANRLIFGFVSSALEKQGLYLKTERVSGRLPFHLSIRGLSLADAEGVWLELPEADIALSPFRLLSGALEVDEVRLAGTRFARLPKLPTSERQPAPKESSGGFSLPIGIRLNELRVVDSQAASSLLAGLLPERAVELERVGNISINLRAMVGLEKGGIFESDHINADARATVTLSNGSGLGLALRAGEPAGGPDKLLLELMAWEAEGGLVAAITGQENIPAYSLHIFSDSSIQQLRLDFDLHSGRMPSALNKAESLAVGAPLPASWPGFAEKAAFSAPVIDEKSSLASVFGSLTLTPLGGRRGQDDLEKLFSSNWQLELAVKAEPGALLSEKDGPYNFLPPLVLELAGKELELSLATRSSLELGEGRFDIESFRLGNELWQAGLDEASIHLTPARAKLLELKGSLLAQIKDERFFSVLGVATPEDGADVPLFGQSALRLDSVVTVTKVPGEGYMESEYADDLPEPGLRLDFRLEGPLQVVSRHPLFLDASKPDMSIALELAGNFERELILDTLSLHGLGLSIDGKSSLAFSPLLVNLDAHIKGEKSGGWHVILSQLSGGIPDMGMDGKLQASLNLDPAQEARALDAKLSLAASGFEWPAEDLGRALGDYVAVMLKFYGPLTSPYQAEIEGVMTGFEALSAAVYNPDEIQPNLRGAQGRGRIEISLSDKTPLRLMPRWNREEQTRLLTLNGELRWALGDIGLFLSEGSDVSGPLSGTCAIAGLVGGAETVLQLDAQVENMADSALHSPLGQALLSASARGDLTLPDGFSLKGKARLDLDSENLGIGWLDSGWQVIGPEGQDLSVGVVGLNSSLAGVEVQGEASLQLPQSGGNPLLNGRLYAHLATWKPVNAVFSRLGASVPTLSGDPLDISVTFDPTPSGQAAGVMLDLPRLNMPISNDGVTLPPTPPGEAQSTLGLPGMLMINGIQGRVDVEDLWSQRLLTAYIKSDSGSADVESWESFAAYLELSGKRGRINMAMRSDDEALNYVQDAADEALQFSSDMVESRFVQNGNGASAAKSATALPPAQAEAAELTEAQAARNEAGLSEREMFSLQAVFRLDPLDVRLDKLAMYAPELTTGLYLQNPAYLRIGDEIVLRNLNLGVLPGGYVKADARFSPHGSETKADVKDLPLSLIRKLTNAPLPDGEVSLQSSLLVQNGEIGGRIDLEAALRAHRSAAVIARKGDPEALKLTISASLGKESPKFGLPIVKGGSRVSGTGRLTGDDEHAWSEERSLVFDFDIPCLMNPRGLVVPDINAPLAARLDWRGEVDKLWALLPVADRTLSGLVDIDFRLGGNLTKLTYGGSAYLAGGRYEDKILGIMLSTLNLSAQAGSQGSKILLSGSDGDEGSLAFEVRLDDQGELITGIGKRPARAELPQITARGQINHLAPLHRDDIFVRLSGIVDANGPLLAPQVKGQFVVEQGNYNIISSLGGGVTTLPVEEKAKAHRLKREKASPMLDISVEAPNRFYVRGLGLDSEWKASATISGSAVSPYLTATVSPVRGYFDLLSRPFVFSDGNIRVWGGDFFDSDLGLVLSHSSAALTAKIDVGGSLSRPSMALSSVPPLPQDQIMAQVLFGKDITQLSAFEALQVANGLRQLLSFGQGGFDVIGQMRDLFGVDTLRIGSSSSNSQTSSISGSPGADAFGVGGASNEQDPSTPTVEAGKYINDKIYLGVEQGTTENSTRVRVEVELKPNLTLQGSSGTQSSQVGLGWKRDY